VQVGDVMQSDPKLVGNEFKKKIEKIMSMTVKVGIPKEVAVKEKSEKSKALRLKQKNIYLSKEEIEKTEEKQEEYVADIAFKLNYGSYAEHIPPRPFGSTTIPRYEKRINEIIVEEFEKYLEGRQSLKKSYGRVGIMLQLFMQHNLRFGGWKPNAPLTVALKGSSQPLIDTGQMRQSITFVVTEREE
jgi:hypothetical protein